jgi:hypothetical protein
MCCYWFPPVVVLTVKATTVMAFGIFAIARMGDLMSSQILSDDD